MNRITQNDLQIRVDYLNKITGNPEKPYGKGEDDISLVHQVGNYHISYAYGGVELQQMCVGGGSRDISPHGHDTKRKLYDFINAYIAGIEL